MSGELLVAAQFQGTLEEIRERISKVVSTLYTKDIYFHLEAIPKMMQFRVLVYEDDLTRAKDALSGLFQTEARKLRVQTDSPVVLKMESNVIKPGQTVLIGRSPMTSKLPGADRLPIEGDQLMGLTHLAVEWNGTGGLRIRDMGEGNGVVAGGLRLTPGEWMELEPGTNVRVGQTTLRFVVI